MYFLNLVLCIVSEYTISINNTLLDLQITLIGYWLQLSPIIIFVWSFKDSYLY